MGGVSMNKRMLWSRVLCVIGFVVMAIDLVGLAFGFGRGLFAAGYFILPGSGLAVLGAFLGRSRYRKFPYAAFGLTACGVLPIVLLWALHLDYGWWWTSVQCVGYAYPVGGLMSCVGAVLVIVESFRRPPVSDDSIETP
jgi:EamA domain-containing membrane protein RarD